MSGIFGAATRTDVTEVLVEGLKRLTSHDRGAVGIATLDGSKLDTVSSIGTVQDFITQLEAHRPAGRVGIGRTRWASAPGEAGDGTTEPAVGGGVAVAWSGAIENQRELRADLDRSGIDAPGDGEPQVLPWLLARELDRGASPRGALRAASSFIDGSFTCVALMACAPGKIHAMHRGRGLVVGTGEKGAFIATTADALAGLAREATVLDDGDMVEISHGRIEIRDTMGAVAHRRAVPVLKPRPAMIGVSMQAVRDDIRVQPEMAEAIVRAYDDPRALDERLAIDWSRVRRLRLIGAGSSYHACLVAKRWFQAFADLDVTAEIASEAAHDPLPSRASDEIAIVVSQSGETLDALRAVERLKSDGVAVFAVVNDPTSRLAQDASGFLTTFAGRESGVIATKSHTAALLVLARVAVHAANRRGLSGQAVGDLRDILKLTSAWIETALDAETAAAELAAGFADARGTLVFGRGGLYPTALEAATKFKELAHLHAEGVAGGEIRHASINLIERAKPILALMMSNPLLNHTAADIRAVMTAGARVTVVGDRSAIGTLGDIGGRALTVPPCPDIVQPIIAGIPLQIFALATAIARGRDPSNPRNLAKIIK